MAGPKVVLTFAGNATDLVTATKVGGAAVESMADRIDKQSTRIAKGAAGIGAAVSGGALAAGGALAGLGLVVGGLGVMVAAKNEQVKASFTSLADHVKAKVTEMAKPFVPVLQGIADKTRATFDKISPSLGRMFETAAPYIDKLATGLLKLVENVMPGLEKGVAAAAGPIDSISRGLAGLGTALGKMFENMSTGAAGGASALDMLFGAINWLLPVLGTIIGKAAEWSGVLVPLAVAIGGVALLVKGITAATAAFEAVMVVVRAGTVLWTGIQWLLNAALTANPIGLVIVAVGALVAAIVWIATQTTWFQDLWNFVWGGIQAGFKAAVDYIIGFANYWWGQLSSIGGKISGVFTGVTDAIKGAFRSAFNFVADAWNNTVGSLNFSVPSWVPGIGGSNFSAPKLPKFHTGGKVPGAPGTEMLAVLQAGERVTSANKTRQSEGATSVVFGSDGSRVGDAVLALVEATLRKQGRGKVVTA